MTQHITSRIELAFLNLLPADSCSSELCHAHSCSPAWFFRLLCKPTNYTTGAFNLYPFLPIKGPHGSKSTHLFHQNPKTRAALFGQKETSEMSVSLAESHMHAPKTTPLKSSCSTLICWHDNWSGICAWPRKYGWEEKMNEQGDMNKKTAAEALRQHAPTL